MQLDADLLSDFSQQVGDVQPEKQDVVVVISCDDPQVTQITSIKDRFVEELNPAVNIRGSELMKTHYNDKLQIYGSKGEMFEKYACLLRKTYVGGEILEIDIKDLLITVVPKIILLRLSQENTLTSIVQKLQQFAGFCSIAGAILEWGMKSFSGNDAIWLACQIKIDDTLAPRFQRANRGHLFVRNDEFSSLLSSKRKKSPARQ